MTHQDPSGKTRGKDRPENKEHAPLSGGVSVVVPMYNEEKAVAGVLESLLAFFAARSHPYEIIVVDDGSTDASARIVARYPVELVRHVRNQGYGRSLKDGIRRARYEYVVFFDADGQHTTDSLASLLDSLPHYDAVIGERHLTNAQSQSRLWGRFFLNGMAALLLGIRRPDLNCGLRGFRREVIARYLHLLPDGFSASLTSTLIVIFRRYRYCFLPVTAPPRIGKSSLHQVVDGFRALNQIVRMAMLFVPWRLFGSTGLFLILGGAAYGVWVYTQTRGFPPSAVMVISTGVSSIFTGLVMDQIAELRKERLED